MSIGTMKLCYSNSEYRMYKDGLTNNDLISISENTNVLVT